MRFRFRFGFQSSWNFQHGPFLLELWSKSRNLPMDKLEAAMTDLERNSSLNEKFQFDSTAIASEIFFNSICKHLLCMSSCVLPYWSPKSWINKSETNERIYDRHGERCAVALKTNTKDTYYEKKILATYFANVLFQNEKRLQ